MDPARQKIAGDCFRRGNEALEARNFKFAVEMYRTCVQIDPGNLTYRQLLRGAEKKSHNDNGIGAGGLSKMKVKSAKSTAAKAIKKEEWTDAENAIEEGLVLNPWDVELNQMLAKVAAERENLGIAEFAIQSAVVADPENDKLLEEFANVLQARNKFDDASKIWSKISSLRPNDGEARAMISRMSVLNTQHRGGYESAKGTKDVKLAEAAFNKKINQSQKDEQNEEDKLQRLIRKDPSDIASYLKLAGIMVAEKRPQEAYDVLKQALEQEPENAGVIEQQQKVELELRRKKVRDLMDAATDEEGKEKLLTARKQLLKRELEIYGDWEKKHPKDMEIKFELGSRLMQVKRFKEAIPLFQKASQSPKYKTRAFVGLGKAFIQDKKLPLARAQFERALPDLNTDNDADTYIEAHYLLARVCQELGDTEKAEEYYGEVIVADYDYKDARERLEALQASGA